jgi:hypothetical protein
VFGLGIDQLTVGNTDGSAPQNARFRAENFSAELLFSSFKVGAKAVGQKVDATFFGNRNMECPLFGCVGVRDNVSDGVSGSEKTFGITLQRLSSAVSGYKCPVGYPWMLWIALKDKVHLKIVFVRFLFFKRKSLQTCISFFGIQSLTPRWEFMLNPHFPYL